jgi:hypothetical protein
MFTKCPFCRGDLLSGASIVAGKILDDTGMYYLQLVIYYEYIFHLKSVPTGYS